MPRIRTLCISDTHGQHSNLSVPDGDVLIHVGDFMTFGDRLVGSRMAISKEVAQSVATWRKEAPPAVKQNRN
jgi:hypothetical protein